MIIRFSMNFYLFSLIPNIKIHQEREKNQKEVVLPSNAIALFLSLITFVPNCVFFLFNENYFSLSSIRFVFFFIFCSCEILCFNNDGSFFFKERTSTLFVFCVYAFFLLSLFTDAAATIDDFFYYYI
jgi:hypothetical protein